MAQRFCTSCGARLADGATFCGACGVAVRGAETAEPAGAARFPPQNPSVIETAVGAGPPPATSELMLPSELMLLARPGTNEYEILEKRCLYADLAALIFTGWLAYGTVHNYAFGCVRPLSGGVEPQTFALPRALHRALVAGAGETLTFGPMRAAIAKALGGYLTNIVAPSMARRGLISSAEKSRFFGLSTTREYSRTAAARPLGALIDRKLADASALRGVIASNPVEAARMLCSLGMLVASIGLHPVRGLMREVEAQASAIDASLPPHDPALPAILAPMKFDECKRFIGALLAIEDLVFPRPPEPYEPPSFDYG